MIAMLRTSLARMGTPDSIGGMAMRGYTRTRAMAKQARWGWEPLR